jgi:hypothetical protein
LSILAGFVPTIGAKAGEQPERISAAKAET